MEKQNKTIVKPEVKFLGTILSDISKGELRVPNFQRPFVWKPDDMIALFESIINGYPIGSLLFWKIENIYNNLDFIGPYKIPKCGDNYVNLILDGHQRLSTLFGVLTNPSLNETVNSENFWKWVIYYDLKEERFIHLPKTQPEPQFIKLNSLLRTLDFLKESRRIADECKDKAEIYIERAERLAQIIREYQIAITQIEGGDLDIAVNIFSRLNSKGMRIAEDRMYSALTYKEGDKGFNLSDKIDEILEKLDEYSFSGIKRMSIFRSILAAAGKNIYTKGRLNIFEDKNLNIPEIVNNCEISLLKAVHFLKSDMQVPSDKFLPYNLQLIVFSEFFRLCPSPNENKKILLRQWFWVTSFVGLYTPNTSKNTQILEEMKSFAVSDDENFKFQIVDFIEQAQPFPNSFNFTSARVRAYVLFLLSLNPKSFEGQCLISDDYTKDGYKALHYLISKRNQLSNRILLGDVKYGFAKSYLIQDNSLLSITLTKEILDSHAITTEALQAIQSKDFDKFLEIREKELIKLEREFMNKNGVIPNKSDLPEAPLDDTE